jgi:predicted enzyme related to lactoylglutathione lyase
MSTKTAHFTWELGRHWPGAPVNALGYLRIIFAVDDIDGTLERLRTRGPQLVGEVVQYKDVYRLCYIRGGLKAYSSDSP